MSSFADNEPLERQRWFTDDDGVRATTKRDDEKVAVPLDWSDALASGETISSVAYVTSGVTLASSSNTDTTTTTTVTGTGEFEVTVTTSASRILQRVRRFYSPSGQAGSDYR
jgi:hypothetical protein